MVGGIQGVKGDADVDVYGEDSGRWKVFFIVGHDLDSQTKVELAQPFLTQVIAPHGCEYMTK